MTNKLRYDEDIFNGVTIDASSLPASIDHSAQELIEHLALFRQQNKRLIWVTLAIEQSALISVFTRNGFHFHSCNDHQLSMVNALVEQAEIPFKPTHTVGAGALVSSGRQILVIQETKSNSTGYKLPGGHVDLGETIAAAAVREVFEETGVVATFHSLCGMAGKFPYRFNKANLYFICRLDAVTTQIEISRPEEIKDAKWVDIDAYLKDKSTSSFNREAVQVAFYGQGMTLTQIPDNVGVNAKHEVLFAQLSQSGLPAE